MSMFLVWSRWSYQDELGASFHMSPQMKCLKPLARFYNLASYDIQTELYDPTIPYISHNLTRQIHSMRWDEIFPIDQTLYIGMNWRNWMFTESLNIYIYYWYLTRKLKILYAGVYRCRIQIKKRFVGGGGEPVKYFHWCCVIFNSLYLTVQDDQLFDAHFILLQWSQHGRWGHL